MSNEFFSFYSADKSRAAVINQFQASQSSIDLVALRVYKEKFGWEIRRSFDDWNLRLKQLRQRIRSCDEIALRVRDQEGRVASLKSSAASKSMTDRDSQTIVAAENDLTNLMQSLHRHRQSLDDELSKELANRFSACDKIFVRHLELLTEFLQESDQALVDNGIRVAIDNYRFVFFSPPGVFCLVGSFTTNFMCVI